MKFYQIDGAFSEAAAAGDKPLRIKIEIDFCGNGQFQPVLEKNILQADFYGLKEVSGGTTARPLESKP